MAVGVVAAVLLAGAGASLAVGRYRPALRPGERYGIDASEHQGSISWARVASDHIGFAYLKATEGSTLTDSRFDASWDAAGKAGIATGAYHFFTFCSPGRAQADSFLAALGGHRSPLPPAVDLELAGNCRARPSSADVARELSAFVTQVEARTHQSMVLYLGGDFAAQYAAATSARPLWLRRTFRHPARHDWVLWQVDGYARVSGVSGAVDLDVARWPSASRAVAPAG